MAEPTTAQRHPDPGELRDYLSIRTPLLSDLDAAASPNLLDGSANAIVYVEAGYGRIRDVQVWTDPASSVEQATAALTGALDALADPASARWGDHWNPWSEGGDRCWLLRIRTVGYELSAADVNRA